MSKHPKGAAKVRCGHWWERRTPGRRYVNARGQCKRETWHPTGYCSEHRAGNGYPSRADSKRNAKSEQEETKQ
jgi:hypothetical protein